MLPISRTMSDQTPQTLKPKHELAAMLLATGRYTDKDIAERLKFSRARLSVLKRSPLFQTLVTAFKSRIHEKTLDEATRALMDDTPTNIKVLKQLRDGDFVDPKVARVQLGAAALLFDRQVPKTVHTTREVSGTVTLEKRDQARLTAVAAEDDPIDVTPIAATKFEEFAANYREDDDPDAQS